MTETAVTDFLKELAVGFRSAKSYPPGHPVMEKVVTSTMMYLTKVYTEIPEFSLYFMEKTVIFQDTRIDVAKNVAIMVLIDALRKIDVESLTFSPGVSPDDMKNLYEVMSSGRLRIKEYGDASTMLQTKGTSKIKINAVKFGIQSGAVVQVAKETAVDASPMAQADLIVAIRNLKELVEKGMAADQLKQKFDQVMNSMEKVPADLQASSGEAVAKVIEQVPDESRTALLSEIELKPHILKLISMLDEDTLLRLIIARAKSRGDAGKIMGVIDEKKFTAILPKLKDQVPGIYEYLAQVGLLLSEKITSIFTKEDLRMSIKPYFNMLDSQNAKLREDGMKSLIMLCDRFVRQGQYDFTDEIMTRLCMSLEHESVEEIVMRLVEPVSSLYRIGQAHNQKNLCRSILDAFNRILGRPGLSTAFKRTALRFMSETRDPAVLPAIFSFLWETGIYPDVRAAIIKFGKDAVPEALLTLKDAEDYSLRMKLVDILKNIGKEAIGILLKNLEAPEWYLRRNIISTLGDIGEKEVAPNLLVLLEDPDERVRMELVKTFAKLDYDEGLYTSIKDPSMEVKAESLRGLKKKINSETIMKLLPLFKEDGDVVHIELLKMIGEKKINEAVEHIPAFLLSLEGRDDAAAHGIVELAITTMVKLDHPKLRAKLENLSLSRDKFIAGLAGSALKRIS
jgi:hypothetical protein